MSFSEGEQAFLIAALGEGLRHDGRGLDEYRPIQIALGVVENAEGSARVRIGGTEVVAAVRPDLAPPSSASPDVGSVTINLEWGTCAKADSIPGRAGRKTDTREVEAHYRDILLRMYYNANGRSFADVDLRSLCVLAGKQAWRLQIDLLVVTNDGGLVDTMSAALRCAWGDTCLPRVTFADNNPDEPEIDSDPATAVRLDARQLPQAVTAALVENRLLVDPTTLEESCLRGVVHVGVLGAREHVCGVTVAARHTLHTPELSRLMDYTLQHGLKLCNEVDVTLQQLASAQVLE